MTKTDQFLYDNYICWKTDVLVLCDNKNCHIQKIVRVEETTHKNGSFLMSFTDPSLPIFCFQIKITRVDWAFTGK